MNILSINGSHRGSNGQTQQLIDFLQEGATAAGARCETIVLSDLKILPCSGCGNCHPKTKQMRCSYEDSDDAAMVFGKMRQADIIIYASPIYVFSMSGKMKTFLDRLNSTARSERLCLTESGLLFHEIDKSIYSKPTVILTCCGNIEKETFANFISYFRIFSRFLDAPIRGELKRTTIGLLEEELKKEVAEQKPEVRKIVKAYRQAGTELAEKGFISSKTMRQADAPLIPFAGSLLRFTWFKRLMLKRHLRPR